MPFFHYAAYDRHGKLHEGDLSAASLAEAAAVIRGQGLVAANVTKSRRVADYADFFRIGRGDARFAALFFRQLAAMYDAMPLNMILAALAKQSEDKRSRRITEDIKHSVSMGNTLAESMQKYPRVFSPTVTGIVAAGEQSGNLSYILPDLADFLEREYIDGERLRSAMMYPLLLAAMLTVSGAVLIFFVLPNFAALFLSLNAELPPATKMLLAFGEFVARYGVVMAAAVVFLLAVFCFARQSERIRFVVDKFWLRLPIIGTLKREIIWQRVLGSLAVLIRSGMTADKALALAVGIPENLAVIKLLENAKTAVEHGSTLAEALGRDKLFFAVSAEFIAVGENVGKLDFMLQKAAEFCGVEAENSAKRIEAAAQPAIMLLLGAAVLLLMLSVVLPLLDSMEALQ